LRLGDTRVVHQDADGAEPVLGGAGQPRHVRGNGHVRLNHETLSFQSADLAFHGGSFSRAAASIRMCAPHFGQTFQLDSRSFFQMICRQPSHFSHSPSVRNLRDGSLICATFAGAAFSFLNQDIVIELQ